MLEQKYMLRGDFDVSTRTQREDGSFGDEVLHLKGTKNLITNTGMDHLGASPLSSFGSYVQVGTGNTAPAHSDSALVSRVAAAQVDGGSYVPRWSWDTTSPTTAVLTLRFVFSVGAATGVLAELGLSASSTGAVTTRSLFRDAGGNPTTVTVLADEQLIITYRLYFTPSRVDSVLVTTQKGVEYTCTRRFAGLGASFAQGVNLGYGSWRLSCLVGDTGSPGVTGKNGTMSADTGSPTGATLASSSASPTYGTYTNGTYYRDDVLAVPINQLNASNMSVFMFGTGVPFWSQIGVSPPMTKTSVDRLTFTIRTSWSRA